MGREKSHRKALINTRRSGRLKDGERERERERRLWIENCKRKLATASGSPCSVYSTKQEEQMFGPNKRVQLYGFVFF